MTPARRANLTRLLSPRHIAFVGGRDAEVAIKEAERRGFRGAIWAVNPRRDALGGHPCHRALADLPEAPDAVFLAVPAPAAVEAVAELARMGAGGIVCYTAGFREAGAAGADLERRLIEAAGDMALIGPNCYGLINYLDGAALWPFAHGGTCPGWGAAIITQSGMLSSDITMAQRSLPLTHMISGGNQSVLTIEDFVDHLADHPAVRAIGIHIEGLRDVHAFEAACLKALDRGVPVVALKTGSSRIGASLTVSHTGSLSGADDLHNALFAAGSSASRTRRNLLKRYFSAGYRGETVSPGSPVRAAWRITQRSSGWTFRLRRERTGRTGRDVAPIATVSNPWTTPPIWGQPETTGPVFDRAIALSKADAAVLVQDYPADGLDESKVYYLNDAIAFSEAARRHGIPAAICATLPENLDAGTREMLIARGVAPMQGIDESLNAMAAAARWSAMNARLSMARPQPLLPAVERRDVRMIEEAEGKARLRTLGMTVPEGRIAAGDMASAVAVEIGFPVVLKMMGPRLAHKSEAGAVALGLESAERVTQVVAEMRSAVSACDPAALTDRFLVEKMAAKPVAELILSVRSDPQFGPDAGIGGRAGRTYRR